MIEFYKMKGLEGVLCKDGNGYYQYLGFYGTMENQSNRTKGEGHSKSMRESFSCRINR
jgi:hypothetical protein